MNRIEITCSLITMLDFDVFVDGERILPNYCINIFALEDSMRKDGQFFIFECWPSKLDCKKITQGVQVKHADNITTWTIVEPTPEQIFTFNTDKLNQQLWQAKGECNRLTDEYLQKHGDLPDFSLFEG